MSLSFIATVLNVIVLATIKNSEKLLIDSKYLFYGNVCVSNIIIGSLVKLMSVVLCGYSVAVNKAEVDFQFCSLMVFIQRVTWFILPFTVLCLPWLDLVPRLKMIILTKRTEDTGSQESSSMSKGPSMFETEAVLTRRYTILKTQKYITVLKEANLKAEESKPLITESKKETPAKSKWMKLKQNIKSGEPSIQSPKEGKPLTQRPFIKQKSKSVDLDDTESDNNPLSTEGRATQSCSELSKIDENQELSCSPSQIYRRKLFAKSKAAQLASNSIDLQSASSNKKSSYSSSNISLNSSESRKYVITLSSFDDNDPPIVIFPDDKNKEKEQDSSSKESTTETSDISNITALKKQVSFDNSVGDNLEETFRTAFAECKAAVPDTESIATTTNMSTISTSESGPEYRLIILMWSISFLYAMFDDHLVSSDVHRKCSVTSEISSTLHITSIVMVLVLPATFGQLLSKLVIRTINIWEKVRLRVHKTSSLVSLNQPTYSCFSLLLTILHLSSYTINMIAGDILYPNHIDIFTYMIVKYCIGYIFCIFFPIIILVSHNEIWRETVRVYKEKSAMRVLTKQEKEEEIGKELLRSLNN